MASARGPAMSNGEEYTFSGLDRLLGEAPAG
jgi:hypothetical protein